jgi:multicomponent K+:H+ antiporter subunit E
VIRRLIPYPGLAAALFVMWLLLAQSVSPGQLLLAASIAIIATRAMLFLQPRPARVRDWRKAFKLAGIVAIDIIRSNLAVASIIVSNRADRTSSFIQLQLELRNEVALTILALIITATPGTAWVQFDRTTGFLLIHVFDLVDEDEWISLLKARYEKLLMAIFES